MSRQKNLIELLSSTEKPEFDRVVKAYLKSEYDFKKIVFTDGKDDTGLDIKVFDLDGKMIQYQLTTQKSSTAAEKNAFERKLTDDLIKAKENHENYRFSNNLIFFYSRELTNKRIRTYEKLAFKDYGINLELIEANRIAEEAEEIIEIQRILYSVSELDKFQAKNSVFDDDRENLVFDMLTFGKPSEFKMQIIEAFILKALYTSKSLSEEEIINLCEERFNVDENNVFYSKLLSRLQSTKKIKKSLDKINYMLTSDEESLLKTKVEQYDLDESLFVRDITIILEAFDQANLIKEYIHELKSLYVNNFNSDLKDLLESKDTSKIFSVVADFVAFIDRHVQDREKSKEIALELLKYCMGSKLIQKVAASRVYFENINNSRLQNYLATQKKIFVDTPVALYALCYFFKPNCVYKNYFFNISKSLIQFARKEQMPLYISERYVWEVQNHIRESYYLVPFSKIENFENLGTSRNVFYNFYLHLLNNNSFEEEMSFSRFLKEFGFSEGGSIKSINSKVTSYLEEMSILKYEIEHEYDIDETNRLFNEKLELNNKFKSKFTRNNDSIMVEFLGDNDVTVHPVKPVFLTWDKTFFDVQSAYLERYPDAQEWLMLPPGKLIDSYSLLKFSIDSETVTESLLALVSDELITNTHSLIDTIKFILNPKNEVSLEYTNRLASIRAEEIHKINSESLTPPDKFEGEAVIDDVFYNLTHHFQEKDDETEFELFKTIFTKKEFMAEVIQNIKSAVDNYYTTSKLDSSVYENFERMIKVLGDKKQDEFEV